MENRLRIITKRRYGNVSPLRYPGGKATLAGFFEDLITQLGLHCPTYVEPYAGGAGAGVALLQENIIDQLVINDINNAVYAFWHCVKHENEWLVEQIQNIPLTVDEWRAQRATYQADDTSDLRALGLAFFYLNRTNRSGILNAGVIGGLAQTGTYKIDARFNRNTLSERVAALGKVADRIMIHNLDGRQVLEKYGDTPNTLIYIDPPYVATGGSLYLNSFGVYDHGALAEQVEHISHAHWILTYDDHSLVRKLYNNQFLVELEITYSATKPGKATELLVASKDAARVITDFLLPAHTELILSRVLSPNRKRKES
ncbi:DNA adenine methylase [Enterococcus sp. AN402]|uniref:DNA adenine methylase n=1 Tax=Enterococcus sp. AN402 TaxID=3151386 RepID=UPI00345806D7